MPRIRRGIRCLSLLSILACLAACVAHVDERALVRPVVDAGADLAALSQRYPQWNYRERRIATGEGPAPARLYAVAATRPDARLTVLFFGGNQFTIGAWGGTVLGIYADAPVNLVMVDHVGYGASEGEAGLDRMFEGAQAAYRDLQDWPELGGRPIVVHGHSLGSFLAGQVADRHRLAGLVLEGSVTTAEAWGAYFDRESLLIRRAEIEAGLRGRGNADVMPRLDEPVLVVTGELDGSTPPEFARALHALVPASVPGELLIVPGANHGNAARHPEFRSAFQRLFLAPAEPAQPAGATPAR
jgi:hypothetical protein